MEHKKVILLYFSATSNTKLIVDTYVKIFGNEGYETEIVKVENLSRIKNINFNEFDLLGIAYPCYAFDYPKKVIDPVLDLINKQISNKPAFIINTYCINSGLSVKNIAEKLSLKNFDIISIGEFKCPSPGFVNITSKKVTHRFKYSILSKFMVFEDNILTKAEFCAKDVINGFNNYMKNPFQVNIKVKPVSYIGIKFAKWNEKRIFNNYKININKCIGCRLCIHQCPANNLIMINEKAEFVDKNNCLRCMKCISNCPKDAITLGRQTEGMDRYNIYTKTMLINDKNN